MENCVACQPNIVSRNISAELTWRDRWRHFGYRCGIGRMSARVEPGLYALGQPDEKARVLVSANYRMSFDLLRAALAGRSAWILVLDTRGINVWCAAGKGTFGTEELVARISAANLAQKIKHRRLILPQLGAVGVAGHEVFRRTGFRVAWGPVRAQDLPAYLAAGRATPEMRRVTFTLRERLVLIPIELIPAVVPLAALALLVWFLGGPASALAFFLAGISAPIAVPMFHDWLPGRWLSIKGWVWGALSSALLAWLLAPDWPRALPLLLGGMACSAYLALNFTGATPYTSVSGVKREMRATLPWIIAAGALSLLGWAAWRLVLWQIL